MRKLPREVHIRFVPNHNVLEVCGKDDPVSVRYVMAQDSETAKERDKYKLRAKLQADEIARLENLLAKQQAVIQKMIDAWDNNDRAKYQGIIEEMEGL